MLVAAIYFTFFFAYGCDDLSCFRAHQKECSRTKFIHLTEETTWNYHIKGKEDGKCKIDVQVIDMKGGSLEKTKLNGKTMTCLLPLGSVVSPEGDISLCHGLLKEELQNLIIQKLHSYVVENLGDISNAGEIISAAGSSGNETG